MSSNSKPKHLNKEGRSTRHFTVHSDCLPPNCIIGYTPMATWHRPAWVDSELLGMNLPLPEPSMALTAHRDQPGVLARGQVWSLQTWAAF